MGRGAGGGFSQCLECREFSAMRRTRLCSTGANYLRSSTIVLVLLCRVEAWRARRESNAAVWGVVPPASFRAVGRLAAGLRRRNWSGGWRLCARSELDISEAVAFSVVVDAAPALYVVALLTNVVVLVATFSRLIVAVVCGRCCSALAELPMIQCCAGLRTCRPIYVVNG